MATEHSAAFIAIRNAILDELDDDDRRRLVGLLGSMTEPQRELSPLVIQALAAIVQLDPGDRRKLSRWFGRYVSFWGQIPVAASRRVAPPYGGISPATKEAKLSRLS